MFVLFFFSTLSTYKPCYQKIDVLHHLRFTVKHNTAPAPPTFPWCAPSHPGFPASTRAFFCLFFVFSQDLRDVWKAPSLNSFHSLLHTPPPERSADGCAQHARLEEHYRADAREELRQGCTTSKRKGDKFVACLWDDAALQRGRGQRKTDPWSLQNHLTFTVSFFSLRLDGQPRRLTELPGSMFILLNWRISFPIYFSEDGRSW